MAIFAVKNVRLTDEIVVQVGTEITLPSLHDPRVQRGVLLCRVEVREVRQRPFHLLAGVVCGILLSAAVVHAQTPSKAVEAAAVDVAKLRPTDAVRMRYMYIPIDDVKEKIDANRKFLDEWHAVLSFWVNSLSRESELVPPKRILPNLWRVDMGDYRWATDTWERLSEVPEPYFSVSLITVVEAKPARTVREWWKGGINPADGKHYDAGWYNAVYPAVEASKKVKAAVAPWIDAKAGLALQTACGTSVPIVRADWWLAQTVVSLDRKAGYYDWLALGKKEADFQALIGADPKKAEQLRKLSIALVGRSGVTLQARSLERTPSLTGYYWTSQDYAKSTAEKNPLRLLKGDITPDASEQIGTLPNGLLAGWLQDGKGARQDVAPDFIASDNKASGNDKRVHSGLCWRCHSEGVRPINDWARKVYQPPFALEDSLDYERTKELRSKYLGDLQKLIKRDQDEYTATIKSVNGLTPAENSKAFAAAYDWHVERDLSLADVCVELGLDQKVLVAALKAEARTTKLDPILAGLVQGVDVRREMFEEVIPLLYDLVGKHGGKE